MNREAELLPSYLDHLLKLCECIIVNKIQKRKWFNKNEQTYRLIGCQLKMEDLPEKKDRPKKGDRQEKKDDIDEEVAESVEDRPTKRSRRSRVEELPQSAVEMAKSKYFFF